MDFFASQEHARRTTGLLVVYFALAVAAIVACTSLAVGSVLAGATALKTQGLLANPKVWNPELLATVGGGTLALIGFGSLYKVQQLASGGGASVARLVGGRLINPAAEAADERMILNVVEEMAIASGTPVPPVYVLENEPGINAFAAGYTPEDAVVAVTRGALDSLSRDELQGVIGHEFSHLLNGDMRLNIRLMGVLHGILLLALIGRIIIRGGSGSRKGGGGILLAGLALVVLGYLGVLFANLIKSAVSRQRELLADAAAVQFTRNPAGLASALKRISAAAAGSRIQHPQAESASHLFFAQGVTGFLASLFATHPPIADRIRRLDPQWDGSPPAPRPALAAEVRRAARPGSRPGATAASGPPPGARARLPFDAVAAIASVGAPGDEHVRNAQALVARLPERLVREVHEPLGAVVVVHALLLAKDPAARHAQARLLAGRRSPALLEEIRRVLPAVDALGPEARLPIAEMAMPALKRLSPTQYEALKEGVGWLVEADDHVTVFEFALQRMILRHLGRHFEGRRPPIAQYRALRPLLPSCARVLAVLAHVGHERPESAAFSFALGLEALSASDAGFELLPRSEATPSVLAEPLERLEHASPPIKKAVLEACAACIGADGRVTVEEAEILRTIADMLDCPMPPLVTVEAVA